jgi:hypothetical protein
MTRSEVDIATCTREDLREIGNAVMSAMGPVEARYGSEATVLSMVHVAGWVAARIIYDGPGVPDAREAMMDLFQQGFDAGRKSAHPGAIQ